MECSSCDYKDEFLVGVVRIRPSYPTVLEWIGLRKRNWLLKELGGQEPVGIENSRVIYHCDTCFKLKSEEYLKVYLPSGEGIEVAYNCKCRKPMKMINEEKLHKVNCPKCKQNTLKQAGMMLWD